MKENSDLLKEYPMYQRYWCCTRTIGTKHSRNCPSVPTEDGPTDDQDDVPVV